MRAQEGGHARAGNTAARAFFFTTLKFWSGSAANPCAPVESRAGLQLVIMVCFTVL